jgi:hypothetical protein
VSLLAGFNVPGFEWNCGLPSTNRHFYAKLIGDLIHFATFFLGLNQHNYPDNGSKLLYFLFSNSADLSVDHAKYGLLQPDNFHHIRAHCTYIRSFRVHKPGNSRTDLCP